MLEDYLINKPVIESKTIRLRPLRKEDVNDLKEWTPNKTIYKYWGKGPGKSDLQPELLFEKEERATKSFHLGIEHKESRKVIGDVYIYLIENNRIAKIAIRVDPRHHNKGIGSEAIKAIVNFCFTNTELKRIWSDVDINNINSCKMLEKCKFTREGKIRQGKMVSTFCDYYIYGILKEDLI